MISAENMIPVNQDPIPNPDEVENPPSGPSPGGMVGSLAMLGIAQ